MKVTCRHCEVVNNKDWGTCDFCGAPLHEDTRARKTISEPVTPLQSVVSGLSKGDMFIGFDGEIPRVGIVWNDSGGVKYINTRSNEF